MNKTKLFLAIGGGVLALILLIFVFVSILRGNERPESATLQFWGTFDSESIYSSIIRDYRRTNPNVNIEYRQIPFGEYEDTLISAFAAGSGPDIWLMQSGWVPQHGDKITPLPQDGKEPIYTFKRFSEDFVDVAVTDLTRGSDIYGLPLYMDTLALYYNKDFFNTAGIATPPRTWEDFVRDVELLTTRDDRGNIVLSAAAIGTARNINRSTDILMLLMLQSGTRMTDDGNTQATFAKAVDNINTGELALQFYTDFANVAKTERYTWNDQEKYSIDAFAEGDTAMMFNYSHHISTLQSKAPRLNFGIAPIPQPGQSQVAVNFPSYWAGTVSKQTKYPGEAWRFLIYLTSTEGAQSYMTLSSRPPARRDLIESKRNDPLMGAFATQALTARSWYQADNAEIESIFADMIDDVNFSRASVRDALKSAENKVNVIMNKTK